ncbi:UDP-N-acetylenolpyruvoylglucosamine reductase [Spirochaeta thermophila DSM 6578]|uniref:UDP-N-acetylenolpyruvoylglucosamine reductase n=1 Tax=Winmispira thermophila (strain ATCC 700085 / DSM 6578 / Z-1203) TaxID=869211 RepID=G0GD51_WINT7|nr:UDP-N-acetylmuramate dehydrogenase [Spirochaeta thermophila]AEJ62126.1 UDP-N-acetylenolpyruvoylglucosamine reductase [Spirochaeta thermophila DSM 6578]
MDKVRKLAEKINITGSVLPDEPMARHTSFQVGGPADLFVVPEDREEFVRVVRMVREEGLPLFVLGGGANILVSDRGVRGVVVHTGRVREAVWDEEGAWLDAGVRIEDAVVEAVERGMVGLEDFAWMPGSVGGSAYMNARCYGRSFSDVMSAFEVIDEEGRLVGKEVREEEFGYKRSPLQGKGWVLVRARVRLGKGEREALARRVREVRADREAKGHFAAPSAGSVFKNNRAFGAPTGVLVDRLGLRGHRMGGAQVSPLHGNIIVNAGGATAREILHLIRFIEQQVYEAYGYRLEREVLLVGEWDEETAPPFPLT